MSELDLWMKEITADVVDLKMWSNQLVPDIDNALLFILDKVESLEARVADLEKEAFDNRGYYNLLSERVNKLEWLHEKENFPGVVL